MSGLDDLFSEPIKSLNAMLEASNVSPMSTLTDEEFYSLNIDDVIAYADNIAGQWNGDGSGKQENRAMQAREIIEACVAVKELLKGMEGL